MKATELIESYKQFVLREGKRPASVYIFMKDVGANESDFYPHFASFGALEEQFFTTCVEETLTRLADSKEYQEYDSSQRLLAFFFTWIEVMTPERSFVQFMEGNGLFSLFTFFPRYQTGAKELVEAHVQKIVKDGIEEGEVADRFFVTRFYKQGFWVQARAILTFWLRDESPAFEKTDAMIEKTLRFALNVIQPNSLDSGFDLVKFFWRNK